MALTPAEVAEKLWMYARLQACESEHRMQPVVAIPKLARIIELMVEDAALRDRAVYVGGDWGRNTIRKD